MRLLGDWVAVNPLEAGEVVVGGILLQRGYAVRSMRGKVVAKAPGATDEVDIGDVVWYEAYSGHPAQSAPLVGENDEELVLLRKGDAQSSAPLDHRGQRMLKNALTEAELAQYKQLEDDLERLARNRRVLPGQTSQPKAGIFARVDADGKPVPLAGWAILEEDRGDIEQTGSLFAVSAKEHVVGTVVSSGCSAMSPGDKVVLYPNSGVILGHASRTLIAVREEELLARVERKV